MKILKTFLCGILCVCVSTQFVYADSVDTIVKALYNGASTVRGSTYTADEETVEISNQQQWQTFIKNSMYALKDSVKVKIIDFKEDLYDVHTVSLYDTVITAKGSIYESYALITYYFKYNSNFRLLRVCEGYAPVSKLTYEERAVYDKILSVCGQIKENYGGIYEREKAIHDKIVSSFSYTEGEITLYDHTVSKLVLYKEGVCEAYATLFYIMCRLCDVPCTIVTGIYDGVDHMWNQVILDGEYYHVDVTNDDPIPDADGRIRYSSFNVSEEEIRKTHTPDNGTAIATGSKYNYYNVSGLVVNSYEDLERIIGDAVASKKLYLTFKTTDRYVIWSDAQLKSAFPENFYGGAYLFGEYGTPGTYDVTLYYGTTE